MSSRGFAFNRKLRITYLCSKKSEIHNNIGKGINNELDERKKYVSFLLIARGGNLGIHKIIFIQKLNPKPSILPHPPLKTFTLNHFVSIIFQKMYKKIVFYENSKGKLKKKRNKREIFSHKKKCLRQSKSKLIFIFGCKEAAKIEVRRR